MPSQDSNPRSVNRKSDAIPIAQPLIVPIYNSTATATPTVIAFRVIVKCHNFKNSVIDTKRCSQVVCCTSSGSRRRPVKIHQKTGCGPFAWVSIMKNSHNGRLGEYTNSKRTASTVFLSMTNKPRTVIPIGSPFRRFRKTLICQEYYAKQLEF